MKKNIIFVAVVIAFWVLGCGDPELSVTSSSNFEPKIVVEGFLYANEPIVNIKIQKNYRIGSTVIRSAMSLTPGEHGVIATINGQPLQYDSVSQSYGIASVKALPGTAYELEIYATYEGKKLHTKATTIVPGLGFQLLSPREIGNITYTVDRLDLAFTPSPGAEIYVFSAKAWQADVSSYIMDGPYQTEIDTVDVRKNLNGLRIQYDALINLQNAFPGGYGYSFPDYKILFYGKYSMTVFAGDKNFKNFLLTANDVAEADGNFHEPENILSNDGIGVFASAIKDTANFQIIKQ